jgi:cardiolipin synthase
MSPNSRALAPCACDADSAGDVSVPLSAPMEIGLFTEGDALYAAMLASIKCACRVVRMESYIFAGDEIGWEFAVALAERAQAGVKVRLHLDAAGAVGESTLPLVQYVLKQGVQVRWFHCWNWLRPLRYNRRNHRKLLVVDERLAYVGGFNVHRESSRRFYGETRWRDTHASISGALVLEAAGLFDAFWGGQRRWASTHGGGASLISNHAGTCRHRIRCLYSQAFSGAREHIYLTTPYFVPDLLMQQRLMMAARRGVDVQLLVPLRNDVPLVRWAARAFYAALIAAGVRVYEYQPRMLHAKTLTIDGQWAALGTANFDYRSFFLNYELVLAVDEPDVCTLLERQFLDDLSQSLAVTAGSWARRRWPQRVLEWVGWIARRWL